jgi:hypothetical protein
LIQCILDKAFQFSYLRFLAIEMLLQCHQTRNAFPFSSSI